MLSERQRKMEREREQSFSHYYIPDSELSVIMGGNMCVCVSERERERGEWGRMSRCANGKRERKKDVKDRERERERSNWC